MPAARSRTRSRRAFSMASSSAPALPICCGSAISRSSPVPTSSAYRQVTGSVPALDRMKITGWPSGDSRNERGAPSENPMVLAAWRGKESVTHLILPASQPGLVARLADMTKPDARRLLLVHAHPDDESIGTGATMAKYAAEGAHVTLVTCTLGELGEVIPPELAHLAWDADGGLGQYRIGELAAACQALGVTDHRFLGGAGRWRDSGMMGIPSNDWPGCFWQADVDEAAGELVKVIEQVRPQVMVTYDDNGFYGHPERIQAHRVAWRAFELADGLVNKFYATALPKSVLAEAMAVMDDVGGTDPAGSDFTK